MKRKLILLISVLFLMLNLAGARIIEVPEAVGGVGLIGGGTPASGSADSCTSGLIFSIHFEADEDVETGDPAGCSVGDTTGTLTGATVVTGADGYLYVNAANEYVAFDVSSADIFKNTGSILMKIELTSYDQNADFFLAYGDADDYLVIEQISSNDFTPRWVGQGVSESSNVDNGVFLVGYTYYIVVRWDVAGTIQGFLYDSSETLIDTGSAPSIANDFGTAPAAGGFIIGNKSTFATIDIKIYYLQVWDTAAGAPSSGFPAK